MTAPDIITSLQNEFPDKTIICLPENNPTEIICETDPSSNHPEYSEIIAYIKKSTPHLHRASTEIYTVLSGQLTLYLDGTPKILNLGETCEILPGVIHSATGDWVKIKAASRPGWAPSDHILVPQAFSAGGVVLKEINGVQNIILVKLRDDMLVLPKGHIEDGETPETASLREVHEETGLSGLKIVRKLGIVTRPAQEKDGSFVIKDIYVYLMSTDNWLEGSRDESTVWLPISQALPLMSPQESAFLRQHLDLIN